MKHERTPRGCCQKISAGRSEAALFFVGRAGFGIPQDRVAQLQAQFLLDEAGLQQPGNLPLETACSILPGELPAAMAAFLQLWHPSCSCGPRTTQLHTPWCHMPSRTSSPRHGACLNC